MLIAELKNSNSITSIKHSRYKYNSVQFFANIINKFSGEYNDGTENQPQFINKLIIDSLFTWYCKELPRTGIFWRRGSEEWYCESDRFFRFWRTNPASKPCLSLWGSGTGFALEEWNRDRARLLLNEYFFQSHVTRSQ